MSQQAIALRGQTDDQLKQELEDAHQELFNLRFQSATRQLADNSQVRKVRHRIATIKTLIREREILAELDREAAAAGE